jgi:hypothetical protein
LPSKKCKNFSRISLPVIVFSVPLPGTSASVPVEMADQDYRRGREIAPFGAQREWEAARSKMGNEFK